MAHCITQQDMVFSANQLLLVVQLTKVPDITELYEDPSSHLLLLLILFSFCTYDEMNMKMQEILTFDDVTQRNIKLF